VVVGVAAPHEAETLAMPFSQLFDLCSLKRGAG
jgi:hypothetical protein